MTVVGLGQDLGAIRPNARGWQGGQAGGWGGRTVGGGTRATRLVACGNGSGEQSAAQAHGRDQQTTTDAQRWDVGFKWRRE